jgi:ATP-dependent Clp protease ATP-binding subunit ClpC
LFERFTERARQIVVLAQDEARALKHNYIGTEHILLGTLRENEGLGSVVLYELGASLDGLRAWVKENVGEGDEAVSGQIPFTPRAKKVLEMALREALSLGHNYIGTEHVLMGLIREEEGFHYKYLQSLDITPEQIRNSIIRHLSGPGRHLIEPVDQIRSAAKNIRMGIKQISRGLDALEAALEQQLPPDPDKE